MEWQKLETHRRHRNMSVSSSRNSSRTWKKKYRGFRSRRGPLPVAAPAGGGAAAVCGGKDRFFRDSRRDRGKQGER